MHRTKETELLRQKCHNLQALLSYHVKKELRLEEEVLRLVKGAIATEYTAFLGLVNEILYSLEVGTTKKHLKEICVRWLQEYNTGRRARNASRTFLSPTHRLAWTRYARRISNW